ncbi:MAG: response regulator [Acidobacteriota bacterium]|nr:response regulator [Acidobacteriota bacterium]
MKRRILLVDDEVAVLLTVQAVLEINGYEVETAASAREAKLRLHSHAYDMVITDMRLESDTAGHEVVEAARNAASKPAIALLTAYPIDEADWGELGSTKLLLKPLQTRALLDNIERLMRAHEARRQQTEVANRAAAAKPASRARVPRAE